MWLGERIKCGMQNAECRIKGESFDAIILVGTGVLDGPRNKGISLFHGGEKAKKR